METQTLIENEFSRNIGILSEKDQEKLLRSQISIAGAGGVGGIHALTLARLGIGRFNLADMDTYGPENVSRQFGAMKTTFGRNKAEVVGEMIQDINASAEIRTYPEGINEDNVRDFLKGSIAYIDGIDFFKFDVRRLLFNTAREMGIYALTAAPLGFGATLQVFAPDGMTFDRYFGITDGMSKNEKLAAFAAGIAPAAFHTKYLDRTKIDMENEKGPAVAPACTLAASLIATETAKIITGTGKIKPVPHYLQFDMRLRKWKTGYILWGGKNPLQKLKRKLTLDFFNGAE